MNTLDLDKSKEFLNDIYACAGCGYCRFGCPVYQQVGFERIAPRGRIAALKRSIEARGEIPETLRESIYMCLQCENCEVNCPMSIDFPKIATKVAEMYNDADALPDGAQAMKDQIHELGNPYGKTREERAEWMPKHQNAPGRDILYFVGCGASYGSTRIPRSVTKMLDEIGIEYNLLGEEENCCGAPLFRIGDVDGAQKMIDKNTEKFRELGAKTIFANCAGCFKTLHHSYSQEFESLHVSQFLLRLVEEGKLQFKKNLDTTAIYFDGCDIGRHCDVYEEPRDLLKTIPGLNLVEYDYNRENAMCCGGPLLSSMPDLAQEIAADRVREAADKGAELIVTPCPTCMLNLKQGAKAAGIKMKIEDLPMILPSLLEKKK